MISYITSKTPINKALAQLVEQWTENPCVPGSIPGGTTKTSAYAGVFFIPPH